MYFFLPFRMPHTSRDKSFVYAPVISDIYKVRGPEVTRICFESGAFRKLQSDSRRCFSTLFLNSFSLSTSLFGSFSLPFPLAHCSMSRLIAQEEILIADDAKRRARWLKYLNNAFLFFSDLHILAFGRKR